MILPLDIKDRIRTIFNDTSPSTSQGRVAYVPRDALAAQLQSVLLQPGSTPFLVGYSGVGKTSLRTEVVNRLLDPERLYSSFRRIAVVQGIEVERHGIYKVVREQTAPFVYESDIRSHSHSAYNSSALLLNHAKLSLVVENLESIVGSKSFYDLLFFCKHLSDNDSHFGGVKVLLAIAGAPELLTENLRRVAGTVELIHVHAWDDVALGDIIRKGSQDCGLEFSSSVKSEIVGLSCGLPRTLHYLARETCSVAVDAGGRRRERVIQQDFNGLLRRDKIAGLINHIFPGISYEIADLTPCQKAIVSLAGRLDGPITFSVAAQYLDAFWSSSRLRDEFVSFQAPSLSQFLVPVNESRDTYVCKDLRLSTAALMHIRLEAVSDPKLQKVYDSLLKVSRQENTEGVFVATNTEELQVVSSPYQLESTVAIADSNGVIRGTGFFVEYKGFQLVVTCAHTLVRMDVSYGMSVIIKPAHLDESIETSVCWMNTPSENEVNWTASEDIALLCPRANNEVIQKVRFQHLQVSVDYNDFGYSCFAYLQTYRPRGTWVKKIEIGDSVDGGFVELFLHNDKKLEGGASGAAVWDRSGQIVGMIQSRNKNITYLTPNSSIIMALSAYVAEKQGE